MDKGWRKNYLRYKSFFLNVVTQYKNRSDLKAYLEILLSLVTISIFSIFALRPTLLTIAGLITEIEDKKEVIAEMDTKIENLSKAQILFDRNRQEITLLENFVIPKEPNTDIFARQIEGLSNRHQVGVLSMSLGEANILGAESGSKNKDEKKDEPKQMEFSVSLTGGQEQYPLFFNFLKDFESLRTVTDINGLTLSLKDVRDLEQKNLTFTIDGNLPYINEIEN